MANTIIEIKINTTPTPLILTGSESKLLSIMINDIPVVKIIKEIIIPILDFFFKVMIEILIRLHIFFFSKNNIFYLE